jgi:hypothetical protein
MLFVRGFLAAPSGGAAAAPFPFSRTQGYLLSRHRLQQLPKLIGCEPSVLDYTAHGKCINWIFPRDGEKSGAIGHDDVLFPLSNDAETGFF